MWEILRDIVQLRVSTLELISRYLIILQKKTWDSILWTSNITVTSALIHFQNFAVCAHWMLQKTLMSIVNEINADNNPFESAEEKILWSIRVYNYKSHATLTPKAKKSKLYFIFNNRCRIFAQSFKHQQFFIHKRTIENLTVNPESVDRRPR